MIYTYIFVMLVFAQVINIITEYKYKVLESFYYIFVGIFLFFIAILRDGIGFDFNNYNYWYDVFKAYPSFIESYNLEFGYLFINYISSSFRMVIFICATLAIPIKLKVIYKYSEDKLMSLMIYFTGVFLMFDMGVIRQGISIAVCLISIKYILNRSLKKFIICIAIGTLFHTTTIIFFPLYFLGYKRYSKKIIYISVLLALIFLKLDLFKVILDIIKLSPFESITYRLDFYTNIRTSGNNQITLSLIKRVMILIIFVEVYKKKNICDNQSLVLLNGYFLSVIISIILSPIEIFANRGTMSLYFLQALIFPIIIKNIDNKILKLITLVGISLLSINTMLGIIDEGKLVNQPYVPYKSIEFW